MPSPDHAATVRAFLDNCVPGLTTPDVADAQAALDALIAALARVEHERDAETVRADLNENGALRLQEHVEKLAMRAERAERQRDRAIKALRRIADGRHSGISATVIARDVLANIEKDTA